MAKATGACRSRAGAEPRARRAEGEVSISSERESGRRLRLGLLATLALTAIALIGGCGVASVGPPPSSDAEAAQSEAITGKLSNPAYTVIALAANGEAATDLAGADGSFSLIPPAETSTLHLRAPDGVYAGPIVLEPARNFELEQAREDAEQAQAGAEQAKQAAKQAKRKLKQAKKKLKRAAKKAKKAKKKVRKASGKQAKRKAKSKLKRAKKKLKKAKRKKRKATKQRKAADATLERANQRLAETERQLEQAERRDATSSQRAITGLRAGAALGGVEIDQGAGYAKVAGIGEGLWTASVDTGYEAQATGGVPIGAGNFGRVSSAQLTGSPIGDLDRDGVPDPLDIDDDGDLVLDKLDSSPSDARASASRASFAAGDFEISPQFQVALFQAVNANAPGLTDEQIEALLPNGGSLIVTWPTRATPTGVDLPPGQQVESVELDCGQPQGSADPGLAYCTTGGTGTLTDFDTNPITNFRFPEDCCDADGDGQAEVFPNPIAFGPGLKGSDSNIWLYHHATSSQIGTGDVLIERVGISDGSEVALIGSVQYVFETTPALVSYSDGQGNSATPDYPVPGSGPGTSSDPFPVQAGPSGDVVLDLTFWRPQRRPIPPETGKWIDMGGLEYVVSIWTDAGYFTCEAGAYATSDPNLEIVDGIGSPVGGGFRDLADDQTPRTDNTFRFQLNLTQCLESEGLTHDDLAAVGGGIQLNASNPRTAGEAWAFLDHSGVAVSFEK